MIVRCLKSENSLFIDASKGFRKEDAKNRLRERDIHKIVTTFVNTIEISGYSRMVNLGEIENNDYNLNIPRYIDNTEEEDIQDIYAHLHGGISERDIDNIESLKVFKKLKNDLFEEKGQNYYGLKIDIEQLQDFVEKSEEVKGFKSDTLGVFKQWAEDNISLLKAINNDTRSKGFIKELPESLLEAFKPKQLVDEYAIYQILLDNWDVEMKDDVYMIIENDWEAKPYRIIEKNKNGKEVDKGWTCDILPKEIVINEFFKKEKEEIEELEAKSEDLERQMEELKEENSGEEGILEEVKNEKVNITKKDLQLKIKELQANTVDFKEDLDILEKYLWLLDEQGKVKKQIKGKEKELDDKLLIKYAELTAEDVKRLVVEEKWLSRLEENINDELDNIILNLKTRIKELSERYAEILPQIEQEVKEYEKKVKEHIKVMGFEI
ncbi:MAG: hypothetical protein DRP84_11035 [Spirochaetes bacterium]|nr:MAG: hypothetical protein DRP84_11035 [Spirochaetota bacterium]